MSIAGTIAAVITLVATEGTGWQAAIAAYGVFPGFGDLVVATKATSGAIP